MKKTHIFGIVVIAIAIAMMVSTTGDASKYVGFREAFEMAKNGDKSKIHVVGRLKKNTEGKIPVMNYEPAKNPNYFTFTLIDSENRVQNVVYYNPKPADFERSEQIVIIGNVQNGQFVADKILMKCPSKYQEDKIDL